MPSYFYQKICELFKNIWLFLGTSTTKLCGTAEGRCYDVALEQMISQEVVGSGKKRKDLCNCLPTCTSIKYEADISHKYLGPDLIENGVNFKFSFIKTLK